MRRRLFNNILQAQSTGYYVICGECTSGVWSTREITEDQFNRIYAGEDYVSVIGHIYWDDFMSGCWKPGETHSDYYAPPESELPSNYKGIVSLYACSAA